MNTKDYKTERSCTLRSVNGSFIDYLKTVTENSGQLVDLNLGNRFVRCFFMWFYTDDKIDLKPCDNINILTIHKRHWDKILPVF